MWASSNVLMKNKHVIKYPLGNSTADGLLTCRNGSPVKG